MEGACFLVQKGYKIKEMGGVLAEKVALIHMENVGKGVKKSIDSIAVEQGLSPSYAKNGNLQKTAAYQRIISKFKENTAVRVANAVDRTLAELNGQKEKKNKHGVVTVPAILPRSLSSTSAKDLMAIVDTGIKNVQLLTGGDTERGGGGIHQIVGMQFVNITQEVLQPVNEAQENDTKQVKDGLVESPR